MLASTVQVPEFCSCYDGDRLEGGPLLLLAFYMQCVSQYFLVFCMYAVCVIISVVINEMIDLNFADTE